MLTPGAIKSPAAAAIDVTLLMPSEYKILLCGKCS